MTKPGGRAIQLTLDLPFRTARGRADFFVSDNNRDALALLDRWPDWPHAIVALAGPRGSGKTHLAHLWQERSGGQLVGEPMLPQGTSWALGIDDADRLSDELGLFHLMNRALAGEGTLLLVGEAPPARWTAALPDLKTRLAAVPVATLGHPDDRLLAVVLLKLFTDRQLTFDDRVVPFLVARLPRSLDAAVAAVAALDAASLARKAPITPQLASDVLGLDEGLKSD